MQVGDVVDDFTLSDQYGQARSLSELVANGPLALFFYPAAMTKGCTAESCSFRDHAGEFAALGAERVGISHDDVAKQRQFSDLHHFDYPLLSDPEGQVASQFGVRRRNPLLRTKRWTFVIGPDRHVKAVIKSELNMNAHVDQALAALRAESEKSE